jgi:hypothetical protein
MMASYADVVADSTQTLLCTYMSGVLLAGLVLNATLGCSWADPIAGLVIAAVAVKEGRQAWRGEGCCAPTRHGSDLQNRRWGRGFGRRMRVHRRPIGLHRRVLHGSQQAPFRCADRGQRSHVCDNSQHQLPTAASRLHPRPGDILRAAGLLVAWVAAVDADIVLGVLTASCTSRTQPSP